jgi:dCTP deaminase
MCVLGKDKLLELIETSKIVYPFDHNLLDGDGYILTVRDETTLHYLEHKNLISYEIVCLSFLNAAKVHSGFIGRLALELVNLSNDRQPIAIKRGDPLMHMEYITRDGKVSPYLGPYQFQYMSQEEVAMYKSLIENKYSDLFDSKLLERMTKDRVGGI